MVDGRSGFWEGHSHSGNGGLGAVVHAAAKFSTHRLGEGEHDSPDCGRAWRYGCSQRHIDAGGCAALADDRGYGVERDSLRLARFDDAAVGTGLVPFAGFSG